MGLDTLIGGFTAIKAGQAQERGVQAAIGETREAREQSLAFQREQTQQAIDFLTSQADIARGELAPLRDAQLSALSQLQGLATPGSEFEQQQREAATTSIQRQLASQGLLRSGRQTAQLSDLELGLAQQRQNILSGLSGLGAVQAGANIQQGLGQQVGGLQAGLGNRLAQTVTGAGSQLAQLQPALAQSQVAGLVGVNNAVQQKVAQLQQLGLLVATGGLGGIGGGGTSGAVTAGQGAFAPTLASNVAAGVGIPAGGRTPR